MLTHPQFNPIAIHFGPLAVHWYGLMYLVGFICFLMLGRYRIRCGLSPLSVKQLDELLTYGVLGVIIGGRLGEVLFYQPAYYLKHPLEILMLWQGGMSFHGGFIGALVAIMLFSHKNQLKLWEATDFIAPLVPLGLGAGRLGNFINGELWGRVASDQLPWAMIFPQAQGKDMLQATQNPQWAAWLQQYGGLPRHPSQLYELVLEGVVLFVLLWWFSACSRPRGQVSALFLVGYGAARFMSEYFRAPDRGIFGLSYQVSMGQWLSLPMIVIGMIWLGYSYRGTR